MFHGMYNSYDDFIKKKMGGRGVKKETVNGKGENKNDAYLTSLKKAQLMFHGICKSYDLAVELTKLK